MIGDWIGWLCTLGWDISALSGLPSKFVLLIIRAHMQNALRNLRAIGPMWEKCIDPGARSIGF